MSRPDLTRWNRGGLDQFRYIDGNAAIYVDILRTRLAEVFPQWEALWIDQPGDESNVERLERLLLQYDDERRDWAWEITRSLARGAHVLIEHIDAYANEGFLGTATQWDNVRRLVAMLDYHPAPPASASTPLALIVKEDAASVVEAGFRVKYVPPDGGPPVIFETLEDLEVDPELNELRLDGWDRNPDPLSPLFDAPTPWTGLGEAKLSAGQVALLIQDSDTSPMQGVVTIGEVVPDEDDPDAGTLVLSSVGGTPTTGWVTGDTRLLGEPREIRRPRMAGEDVIILDGDPGLVAGDIVAWKEGDDWKTATVEEARGPELRLSEPAPPPDTDIVKVATIKRPDTGDFRIPAPSGTKTLMVRTPAGELEELARVEDPDDPTIVRLHLDSEPYADQGLNERGDFGEYYIVTDDTETGQIVYLIDDEPEESETGVGPPAAVARVTGPPAVRAIIAPPAPPLVPEGPSPAAGESLEFDGGPGELASGQWAVGEDRNGDYWPLKIEAIEEREDGFTLTLAAQPAPPSAGQLERVYGAFAGEFRPRGYDVNPADVLGDTLTPAGEVHPLMVPGRRLVLEHDPPADGGTPVETTVKSADPPNGTIVLDRGLTGDDGFTLGNTLIRGNVVAGGHGESKPGRVLGSGDAAQSNQSFVFEVEDISFVADSAQSAGVRAAITVAVGERTYEQVSTLADSGPADPQYTVRMTEDGYLRLTFGDGRNGRRLETGTGNVRVTSYRVGTGSTGNAIAADGLTKPVKPHYLVDEVRQPLATVGGNAMEDVASLRENAPSALLTLGRAVSLSDFANLAASQSSVWHATSFFQTGGCGRREAVEVVVVPAGGGELGALEESIADFLKASSLPGVEVTVSRYVDAFAGLAVTVRVKSAEYDPDKVAEAVRAALGDLLTLSERRPGQPLYRSEIFEAVEAVTGVENSDCVIKDVTVAGGEEVERIARGDDGSIRVVWPTQRQVVYVADAALVHITHEEFAL